MKAVLQRVSRAEVRVDGRTAGAIGSGLVILVCAVPGDTEAVARQLAAKIANLRIFEDEMGKMNRALLDLAEPGPAALVVSQFTLAAAVRKGRRPSFVGAAAPELAIPLLEAFRDGLHASGVRTETGIFGAHMEVELVNDGPVTIWLDTEALFGGQGAERN